MHISCAKWPEGHGAPQQRTAYGLPRLLRWRPGLSAALLIAAFLGASWFLFFYHLADRDLWSSHEGRAGQNAVSVLRADNWALPRLFDGTVELQKPPLYYWLVALAGQWQGSVDAWTVRLPAAVSAVGGVLAIFLLLMLRGRLLAGILAAVILATAIHYTWLGRTGRIDMPLTFCVTVALCCYCGRSAGTSSCQYDPARDRSVNHHWIDRAIQLIGYLAIAAAIMLKGPIGAALPAAVCGTWLLLDPPARRWPKICASLAWGIPLVLALVLPWYLWANAETHGQFLGRFFWYDNIERALGEDERLASKPLWFYLPRFTFDFLPWSPLLLVAAWCYWRKQPVDAETRFGMVWLAGIFVLLSLVRFKRADYLLPAYPGAAIFLGCIGERWYRATRQPRRWALAFTAVVLATLGGWWLFLDRILPAQEAGREQRTFAAVIREHVPLPQFVLFFRVESHLLAFHVGPPLYTFLEWENLDVWAGRPGEHWIVMPPECADEWPRHVTRGQLEEVARTTDFSGGPHAQPLVLMRIRNLPKPSAGE